MNEDVDPAGAAHPAPRVVSVTIGRPDGSVVVLCDETTERGHTKSELEALPLAEQLAILRPALDSIVKATEFLTRSVADSFAEMVDQLERVACERGWVAEPATAGGFVWREARTREARPREHRAGRGHTRRGPPVDDDPHDQPLSALVAAAGSDEDSDAPHVAIPPGWTPIQVVWHVSRLLLTEPREHWHMSALHERRGDYLAFGREESA